MDRSATYDFLLTFHSNHGPISYRFQDKRRFQSIIANFSHPRVFNATAEGVSLGIRSEGSKTRMIRLPEGQSSFKIGLAVETQYTTAVAR